MRPLRVVLDARLSTGSAGGVESVIIGLARGLCGLNDGDEEYQFLTYGGHDDWIRQYLRGPCRPLAVPAPTTSLLVSLRRRMPSAMRRPLATRLRRQDVPSVPVSDGTIERADADLMHFTYQNGFMTVVPSIYQPHDLQHLHLPENFDDGERRRRESWYRLLCHQARMVAVGTSWTRHDLIEQYALDPDKVSVIPLAPVVGEYGDPAPGDLLRTKERYDLPEAFALYPAQTWPHKNHVALLEALATLRLDHDLIVPLVCTGGRNWYFPEIQRTVAELGLGDQVRFLGFVPPAEMRDLYRLARAVVIPSLFESASAPLWEAFLMEVPAACSDVTSLPEQAGDAAIIFDPRDVVAMATAISRVWTDEQLRAVLVERGSDRVRAFTWERTARHFRAHYRRLANRALDDADLAVLASPPLI